MPILSQTIANLINGVSQQPDPARLPSQVELQENAFGSVADGLFKRPCTEHIKTLSPTARLGTNIFTDFLEFPGIGKFAFVIAAGVLRIWNVETGVEYTVNYNPGTQFTTDDSDPEDYLPLQNSETDLTKNYRFLNMGDHALLLNRSVTAEFDLPDPARALSSAFKQYLVEVRTGDYSKDYNIVVEYKETAGAPQSWSYTKSTSATLASDIKTEGIAAALETGLTALVDANIFIRRYAHVLHFEVIDRTDVEYFRVYVADSSGGTLMRATQDTVQEFSELPRYGMSTFHVVKVLGEGGSSTTPYYVRFQSFDSMETDGTEDELGPGAWVECASDKDTIPDPLLETLPIKITPPTSGTTFQVEFPSWSERLVGDEDTNPTPGFHGKRIADIFLYKNRLGLIQGSTVSLSEHGEYFNFLRSTTITLLDSDPIEFSITHPKAASLQSAVQYQGTQLLFSEHGQFIIPDDDLLTPRTVSATIVSDYQSAAELRPVTSGGSLFFHTKRGSYNGYWEFNGSFKSLQDIGGVAEAAAITGHIPRYVEGTVIDHDASAKESCVGIVTDTLPTGMYFHQYHWIGDQKIQASWSKLLFDGHANNKVHGIGFVGSYMYLIIDRYNPGASRYETMLERMPLLLEADSGLEWRTNLDRRITESGLTRTYNPVNERTTITLPYGTSTSSLKLVIRTASGTYKVGQSIPVVSASSTSLVVSGDHTATEFYIGEPYTMRVRLSTQYLREQDGNVNQEGRLQLRTIVFQHAESGYYEVEVTPDYRDTYSYVFNQAAINQGQTVGEVALHTGNFPVAVLSKNDQVEIDVLSDSYLPVRLLSAYWTGLYTTKTTRV